MVCVCSSHVGETESGHVYSWGNGAFGQLGLGDSFNVKIPDVITTIPGNVLFTTMALGQRVTLVAQSSVC